MADEEPKEVQALREALAFSPNNIALIKHLSQVLIKYGHFESAETELKQGLQFDSNDSELKATLANVYFQQGKASESLVLLEDLETRNQLNVSSLILFAKILSETTELVKAAEFFKRAKEIDPAIEDEALESELAPFLIEYADNDPNNPLKALAGNQPGTFETDLERPNITFENVGGMESVKEQIRMKIIHPIANADLFKAYGKTVGGGLLLYGPPGCGKTFLARATAGEVNARFLSIGLHDILGMWVGESEKNLHELFDQARSNKPSVLFFDEVDALAAKRSDMRQSASRHTINQFLAELDGVDQSNDGVLIMAATNAPWHLDSAFRRPGRFDRILFVPPPDFEARVEIIKLMLKDKPSDQIDYKAIASKTADFTGADLKAVVDQAVENTLNEAMKSGNLEPIRTSDLLKSAKKVKPSAKEWFATAKNHALFANQAGLYDDILEYLKIKK